MDPLVRILHLEDDAGDAELALATLDSAGIVCQVTRVQTRDEFGDVLRIDEFDIILADFQLPAYDGMSALRLTQKLGLDVPFIFVSGAMGEDAAIEGLTEGATDYVLKQKLSRLGPAVKRALRDVENQRERKRAEEDLRASQEKFRTVANFTYDWEYWRGPERDLVWVSPSCERVTGYTEAEFMANEKLLEDIIHPEDLQSYLDHRRDSSIGRPEIISMEFRIINRSGRIVWINHRCAPIVNPDGNALGRRVCNQDITDRKRGEAERQELEAQLRQTQKMEAIGTLAGGIAHDFNNILAAIIGYSELALQETDNDSSIQDKLKKILAAGHRGKELVQQILRFSRGAKQEQAPITITPIIKETLKLLRASLPSTIDLVFNQDIQTDVVVADATQIHQLLMNLCTNAAHAMREKGGVLEIGLKRAEIDREMAKTDLDPGPYLKLSVTDTGHGMDKQTLERIFEPFFTTKDQSEGTGMGLSVVHGIVKSHRGAIKVQSQVGTGTKFNIFLPLAEKTVTEQSVFTSSYLPTGTERILFVDDEPNLVDWGQELFERLGYRVTSCISSLEALSLFQARPYDFDLVITDQTMPNLTGMVLARKMMKIRPDIPVILCTGFSQQVTTEIADRIGIKKLMMKPLLVAEAAQVIRAVLDEASSSTYR